MKTWSITWSTATFYPTKQCSAPWRHKVMICNTHTTMQEKNPAFTGFLICDVSIQNESCGWYFLNVLEKCLICQNYSIKINVTKCEKLTFMFCKVALWAKKVGDPCHFPERWKLSCLVRFCLTVKTRFCEGPPDMLLCTSNYWSHKYHAKLKLFLQSYMLLFSWWQWRCGDPILRLHVMLNPFSQHTIFIFFLETTINGCRPMAVKFFSFSRLKTYPTCVSVQLCAPSPFSITINLINFNQPHVIQQRLFS